MDHLNFGKYGTPVFWLAFALLLAGGGWATFPEAGSPLRATVTLLGIAWPWKWVFAAWFFVALGAAAFVALAVQDLTRSTPDDESRRALPGPGGAAGPDRG